ncbi:MAG: methyltransferase [Candidatus Pacearchaeota archaeon]
MYQPAEDSLLLEKYVEKFAFGKVLDIGTGIGIQAVAATRNKAVKYVLAIDIDKEAINYCKRNIKNKKILFMNSDLFSNVNEKFDTIIFNPPYLPEDKDLEDKEIYGGKNGIEIIDRFFSEVKNYLNKKGNILLVFSSITGKKKVDEIIKKAGFKFKELGKQHIFFEDLFVYLIQWP